MTKITANLILIIMAIAWGVISIRLCVLVEVSDSFLWLAGILAGGNVGEIIAKRYGVTIK